MEKIEIMHDKILLDGKEFKKDVKAIYPNRNGDGLILVCQRDGSPNITDNLEYKWEPTSESDS
jgi:hypothetical protein